MSQEMIKAQASSGCEYIPMLWGEKDLTETRLANLNNLGQSSHLLGFNEPNFGSQVRTISRKCITWCLIIAEVQDVSPCDSVSHAHMLYLVGRGDAAPSEFSRAVFVHELHGLFG